LSLLQGRAILYAAIAGLLAMMGGIVLYASLDNPELEKAEIQLDDVRFIDINNVENRIKLQTVFLIKNPSEKTFTVPTITYELFANEKSIGSGQYSTADIAMPGRAAFYPDAEIPLKNFFYLILSEKNSDVYDAVKNGEYVKFTAKGILTVETAWSIVEMEFESSM